MWRYYDFRANWPAFLEAWNGCDVQEQLCADMQRFCAGAHAFCVSTRAGAQAHRRYTRGDPLWWYSATPYWHDRAAERALERVREERMLSSYKKTMNNLGFRYKTKGSLEGAFFNTCFEDIVKDCYPERGTLDAFIAPGSEGYLSGTYYAAARALFPGETVIHSISYVGNCVLLPDHKVLFDISGYYFDKPVHCAKYDNLYDEFTSYDSSSFSSSDDE